MSKSLSIKTARQIPNRTKLFLFVFAGGRCEFNGCNNYLLEHPLTFTRGNFSQDAHIVAFSDGGPRGNTHPRPNDIHSVENLMLLCPACHKLIDDHPEEYSTTTLIEYKKRHEGRIKHLTNLGPDLKTSIIQLKSKINGDSVDIPVAQVTEAIAPRYPSDMRGLVIDLTSIYDDSPEYYQIAARTIQQNLDLVYAPGMDVDHTRHISLFALAPIPVMVFLGSRLSNKIPVDLFQRHRDTENWVWKTEGQLVEYEFKTLKAGCDQSSVALLLSLSGKVHLESLPREIDEKYTIYEITLKDQIPNPMFLRLKQDMDNFKIIYQFSIRRILHDHGILKAIHLFPAVPAPIAVICGRELLPKVDPALYVYDNHKKINGFNLVMRINDND